MNFAHLDYIRMLFVAADPTDSVRLDTARELRTIEQEAALVANSCQIVIRAVPAATAGDVHRALLEHKPHIIHIGGHASDNAIWLRDEYHTSRAIPATSLASLLSSFKSKVCLVVVNTCKSDIIAAELTRHIPYAIGFERSLDDIVARRFASALYRALVAGESIESSFRQAVAFTNGAAKESGARLHFHQDIESMTRRDGGAVVSANDDHDALQQPYKPQEFASSSTLIEAIRRRDLVLVAGTGIRTNTGLSTWPIFVSQLREYMRTHGASRRLLDDIDGLIEQFRFSEVLADIELALGSVEFGCIVERLLKDDKIPISEVACAISEISPQLRTVLTTNLDRMIERAFAGQWPMIPRATGDIAQRERIIFKLHGTLGQRDTWLLTSEQYRRAISSNSALRDTLRAFFQARTLLFVGYLPDDPDFEHILDLIERMDERQPPSHHALFPVGYLKRMHYRRLARAGIRVSLFQPVRGALTQLLRALAEQGRL